MKPAYFIFIVKHVHDRAKLVTYWERARGTFAGHTVKMLAGYGPFQVLEGDDEVRATVIAEFPSMQAALDWYHSPAYAEIRQIRLEGADFLSLLVEAGGYSPVAERLL